jgi:hypothetical protein
MRCLEANDEKIRKRIIGSRSSWFAIFGKKPTFVPYGTPFLDGRIGSCRAD